MPKIERTNSALGASSTVPENEACKESKEWQAANSP